MAQLLIIYFDIGDEDGPAISYSVVHYDKHIIPPSHIKVVNNGDSSYRIDDTLSYELGSQLLINANLKNSYIPKILPNQYNIVDILEVHDWYDYLDDEQVASEQKSWDISVPHFVPHKGLLRLTTILPYNKEPLKYIIPIDDPVDEYIKNNLGIFDVLDDWEEKQALARIMAPYKINASYYDILQYYSGQIIAYSEVISDEIDVKIDF